MRYITDIRAKNKLYYERLNSLKERKMENEVMNEMTNTVEKEVKNINWKQIGIVGGVAVAALTALYGVYTLVKDKVHISNPFAKKDQTSTEENSVEK